MTESRIRKGTATPIPSADRPEYAVLPWEDYQALLKAASGEEDALDAALLDALPDYEAADFLPDTLVKRMIAGESPIKIWCEHRNMKSSALARQIGISPGYLSDIMAGKKGGSVEILRKIADALGVTLDDIVPAG
jgi:DNA-binding Xre family transcriptional regulator